MKVLFIGASVVALLPLLASDVPPQDEENDHEDGASFYIEQGDPRYEELLELTRLARENPLLNGRRRGFSGSSGRPPESIPRDKPN